MKNAAPLLSDKSFPEETRPAAAATLRLLLEAWQFALGKGREAWTYALTRDELLDDGGHVAILQWLTQEELVKHLIETTRSNVTQRQFQASRSLRFGPRSCFMLTDKGLPLALAVVAAEELLGRNHGDTAKRGGSGRRTDKPRWVVGERQLFAGGVLLHEYAAQACNCVCLLTAFQEVKWRRWMDDPIPGETGIDPVQRLRDTVYRLNANQDPQRIQFNSKDGKMVGWQWLAAIRGMKATDCAT